MNTFRSLANCVGWLGPSGSAEAVDTLDPEIGEFVSPSALLAQSNRRQIRFLTVLSDRVVVKRSHTQSAEVVPSASAVQRGCSPAFFSDASVGESTTDASRTNLGLVALHVVVLSLGVDLHASGEIFAWQTTPLKTAQRKQTYWPEAEKQEIHFFRWVGLSVFTAVRLPRALWLMDVFVFDVMFKATSAVHCSLVNSAAGADIFFLCSIHVGICGNLL